MLQPGEQVPVSVSGTLVNGDAAVFAPGDLVFTSDHPEVASVSADGIVTANENGVAQITCEATLDGITRQRIAGIHRGRRSGRSRLDASLPQRLH